MPDATTESYVIRGEVSQSIHAVAAGLLFLFRDPGRDMDDFTCAVQRRLQFPLQHAERQLIAVQDVAAIRALTKDRIVGHDS